MTQALVKNSKSIPAERLEAQKDLIKRMYCKGSTDDELQLFMHTCEKTGLDPLMKQIYAVKRKSKNADGTWGESMSIQTSIDGFRLIAERTGNYSPGREATFTYTKDGEVLSATSYVKKRTSDGTWHEVAASAFYDEYVQNFKDKNTGEMKPSQFWERMPHVMLAKCAESLALRKAFPGEFSAIYSDDEMAQASNQISVVEEGKLISSQQAENLDMLIRYLPVAIVGKLTAQLKISSIYEMQEKDYERSFDWLQKNLKKQEEKNESSAVA